MTEPREYIFAPNNNIFPNNATLAIKESMQRIDPELHVVARQLVPSDPNEAVGVFPLQWTPDEESQEMRGVTPQISEATLSRYSYGIQSFVKDYEEDRGLARHAVLSRIVRGMLYRDPQLAVALRSLSVVFLGTTERYQRHGIRTARFLSNEVSGQWLFLSTHELWLETETIA